MASSYFRFVWRIALAAGIALCAWPRAQAAAASPDSAFKVLYAEIAKRDKHASDKEAKIASIRADYASAQGHRGRFETCKDLFEEYRCYQSDSAYRYALALKDLSEQGGDRQEVAIADMALMDYYTSVGFFKEAAEMMDSIDAADLPASALPEYYNLCNRFYQNICGYVGSSTALGEEYNNKRVQCLESLIEAAGPNTATHDIARLELAQLRAPSPQQSIDERLRILQRYDLTDHQKAVQYSIMGRLAMELGQGEEAKRYLALSAAYDIRGNIKETTAAKMLAEMCFAEGDVDRAYGLIHIAFDDASFYNSHLRRDEISSIMRMIDVEQRMGMKARMWKIAIVSGIVFLLLVFTLTFVSRIRKKKREVETAYAALESKSAELDAKNNELNALIGKLREVTEIKDEYIMQTLYLNTSFVNKVEGKAHDILKLLKDKKYDELRFVPYDMGIKEERARIYRSFDKAFLSLFPNFISEYNKLFSPAEQPLDPSAQELPVEVRIFPLLRLGISDTQEVAKYLNLSVKTVYVYKTKVKSKSMVDNADFEDKIMAIPKP